MLFVVLLIPVKELLLFVAERRGLPFNGLCTSVDSLLIFGDKLLLFATDGPTAVVLVWAIEVGTVGLLQLVVLLLLLDVSIGETNGFRKALVLGVLGVVLPGVLLGLVSVVKEPMVL